MSTIKALFALSCNVCAMCEERLTDPAWKQVKADIAHICGEKPGAARYDPSMTAEARNDFANLLLLCPNCHRRVDRLEPDKYPVERLGEIKARREEACHGTRWTSDERLDQVTELLLASSEAEADQRKPPPRLVIQSDGNSTFVANVGDSDAYHINVEALQGGEAWVPADTPPPRLSPGVRYRAGVVAKGPSSTGPFVLRLSWNDGDGASHDGEFPFSTAFPAPTLR